MKIAMAARTLLHSLAHSLEQNHQDPWLTEFLPHENPKQMMIF